MIFLVPVGFILGGATMAVGFLHGWVKFASFGIPLVWIFNFWRDIGLRGIDWAGMADLWGCFFGYLTFIALLVGIRFWREEVKMMADRKDALGDPARRGKRIGGARSVSGSGWPTR